MTTKNKSITISSDKLRAYVNFVKSQKESERKRLFFEGLVNHFISLHGVQGTGKTCSGVMFAYTFREMTGRPVVIVGTNITIFKEFGEYQFISGEDFVCQMRGIAALSSEVEGTTDRDEIEIAMWNWRGCTNPAHNPEHVQLANMQWRHESQVSEKAMNNILSRGEPCWTSQNGIVIFRSIILLDEGNEFIGGDTASNPLVRLFQRFVQIMRHLNITLILMVPYREDIAPKPRRQVWTFGQCASYKELGYIKVSFSEGVSRMKTAFKYDPIPYLRMYDTETILSLRASTLNIAEKHL